MPTLTPTRLHRSLAALAVVAGLAGSVALVETAAAPADPALSPGTAAMRIAIDPDTGELVPAQAVRNKAVDSDLATMLSKSSEGLVEVHHPDGHVSVDLQGRFMSASLARINADGELESTCVESAAQAEHFLGGGGTHAGHDHADQPEVQ